MQPTQITPGIKSFSRFEVKQLSTWALLALLSACGGSKDSPLIASEPSASSNSPAPTLKTPDTETSASASSAEVAAAVSETSASETSAPTASAQPSSVASASASALPSSPPAIHSTPAPPSTVTLPEKPPLVSVPWLPVGALGQRADILRASVSLFAEAFCRSGLPCAEKPADDDSVKGCTYSVLQIVAPPLGWLACAVHSHANDYLDEMAVAYLKGADDYSQATCISARDIEFPNNEGLTQCPAWDVSALVCPDSGTSFTLCDGQNDCPGGFDELNCLPSAASYRCGVGPNVLWPMLCDGTKDCTDGNDEFACQPTP